MFSANDTHELKGRKKLYSWCWNRHAKQKYFSSPSTVSRSRFGLIWNLRISSTLRGKNSRKSSQNMTLLNWVRQCRIGARLHCRTLVWWSQARPRQTSKLISASQFWMLHRSVSSLISRTPISWDLEIDWLVIPNSDLGQNHIEFLMEILPFPICAEIVEFIFSFTFLLSSRCLFPWNNWSKWYVKMYVLNRLSEIWERKNDVRNFWLVDWFKLQNKHVKKVNKGPTSQVIVAVVEVINPSLIQW
jgi:hypothetical protein